MLAAEDEEEWKKPRSFLGNNDGDVGMSVRPNSLAPDAVESFCREGFLTPNERELKLSTVKE